MFDHDHRRRSMRRLATLAGLTAALLAPAAARADKPAPGGHQHGAHAAQPATSTHQNASQMCRAERGTTDATRTAFRTKYGTNHNGANAFGKCVSAQAKALRQMNAQQAKAEVNAAKSCNTERGTTADSRAAFAAKYGTGHNQRNAFGRCVSATAKASGDEGDGS
jgi:hypothetical protein